MSGVRRIVLWGLSTLTVLVLLLGYRTSTSSSVETASPSAVVAPATAPTTTDPTTTDPAATDPSTSGTSGTSGTTGQTTGTGTTVTGSTAQTRWGPVQVRLALAGDGTITAVTILQQPSGNPRDEEINAIALPILVQETTDAQSADIDMVSGATVTSQGYLESLQSALDQVRG